MNQRFLLLAGLGLAAAAFLGLALPLSGPPSSPDSEPSTPAARRTAPDRRRSPIGLIPAAPPAANSLPAQSPPPLPPPFEAFHGWTVRFLAASPAERDALLPEGLSLAASRRAALAALIRTDPQAALAAAVPMADRALLPVEVVALLEERISAQGRVALTYACLHPYGNHAGHGHELFRSTLIGERQFTVHTFGRRETLATVENSSLVGIAVDSDLALADSPARVLETGETSGSRAFAPSSTIALPSPQTPLNTGTGTVAVEAGGIIHLLASRAEIPAFEQNLRQTERVNEADNQPGSSTVVGRPTQAWSQGTKKVLVIRVDFSDLPGTPLNKFEGNATITEDYVVNVINQAGGVRDFFSENSFGKTSLTISPTVAGDSPDVTQVFRVPNTAASYATAGNNDLLHQHATNAAAAAGYNLATYDRIGVVFSNLGSISGSKITYGGLANVIGPDFWVNGAFDFRVVGHEIGHTYGLRHANLWQVTDGNAVSPAGSSLEYGDPFDLMGGGDFFENAFSHLNKSILQWIPDTAVTVAGNAGTYRIYRFDSAAANLAQPRALKVVRDSTRDYWIGYRRATANAALDSGAYVLWGYNVNQPGNLLDLKTPGTNPDDAALPIGQTYNDSATGISLTSVAQGGAGAEEWLDVQVAFQPRIQWSKSAYTVNEQGGSALLTLTRTSNSVGAVSVTYATSPGTATTPADFTTTSGTVTWANGDTAPKTVTIPVTADALVEGSETFTVNLSGVSGGVIVDGTTATVTLADPGARDLGFTSDFINNSVTQALPLPDGSILVSGYFDLLQDASFNVYPYHGLARVTSAGKVDTAFNSGTGANDYVAAFARQPDGRIIAVGDFTTFNGTAAGGIVRLNTDGSLDTSFNAGTGANLGISAVLVQPDAKILIGGLFTTYNGTPREYLARLNSDGSLDTSFAGPDFAGSTGWIIRALALQPDGKILIGGAFYYANGQRRSGFSRLTTSGAFDSTLNGLTTGADPAFQGANFLGQIHSIALQPDGKIILGGDFTTFNGTPKGGLVRLTSTGAIEATFTGTASDVVETVLLQPDGKVLVGGDFTTLGGGTASRLGRLSATGVLDTAFSAAGGHAGTVHTLAWQPDGNVVLGGVYANFQGSATARPLWRFLPGLASLPGSLQFSTDAYAGSEGGTVTLTVNRTGGSLGPVTVGYSTVAGTATAADFTPNSGVLTWADGDSTPKTITLSLTADALAESPETLRVNLGPPLLGGVFLGERQQATVTVSTVFATWQSQNFSTLEQASPAVSGDTADPDGDGLSNLLEYALGVSPKSPSPNGLPAIGIRNSGGANYLALTFRRRLTAPDLTYLPQTAASVSGPWLNTAVAVGTPVDNGDGTETVTYRDSTPLTGANQRFLRLSVTRTE